MLPDEDGLSILKSLRTRADTQKIPVILVTAKSTEIDKVKGLDGGADGLYRQAVRRDGDDRACEGASAPLRRAEESLMTCGNVTLDSEKRMVYVDGKPVELTYKEFELLKLLMKNHGIVISRDVIMERVWDSSFEGESRTIDVHVRTLRQKLGDGGALIKTHPQRRLYGGSKIKVWGGRRGATALCIYGAGKPAALRNGRDEL